MVEVEGASKQDRQKPNKHQESSVTLVALFINKQQICGHNRLTNYSIRTYRYNLISVLFGTSCVIKLCTFCFRLSV